MAFKRDIERDFETKDVRGIWIMGTPGVGKTHVVLANYRECTYEKS